MGGCSSCASGEQSRDSKIWLKYVLGKGNQWKILGKFCRLYPLLTHRWCSSFSHVMLKVLIGNLKEWELHISVTGAGFLGLYIYIYMYYTILYLLIFWDNGICSQPEIKGQPLENLNIGPWIVAESTNSRFLGIFWVMSRTVLFWFVWFGVGFFVCFWLFFLVGCFECSLFSTSAIFNVITLEISAHWGRMS